MSTRNKIWKSTWLDSLLLLLSIMQLITMLLLAAHWQGASLVAKLGGFALLVFMFVYNIIVISHLFTHVSWFVSPLFNSLVSILNTINIGQSVQVYRLRHVRNHHRFNNDQKWPDGKTKDTTSTYLEGVGNEHATLYRYAFVGAYYNLLDLARELILVNKLWHIDDADIALMPKTAERRADEMLQVRLDRLAHLFGILLFLAISWQWTLFCYLPAFYLGLALVNVQNYYEHYGANPNSKFANSISYYGRLYNFLAFNDGHHQEHHLRPGEHWSAMPQVRRTYNQELVAEERIISPVPSIVGFLHHNRKLLHKTREI